MDVSGFAILLWPDSLAGTRAFVRAGSRLLRIAFGFSALAFAQERDRTYVIVTLIALAVLTYSLAGGQL